jgi:hypothetical protein
MIDHGGGADWSFPRGSASFLPAGLVLPGDVCRDPAAVSAGDAVGFGPGADLAAVVAGCGGAGGLACRAVADFAGVVDEGGELGAEGAGVLAAQVDFVAGAEREDPLGFLLAGAVGRPEVQVDPVLDGLAVG